MKIDVLIVFEHASRELESAVLLEKKLIEQGFIVKIVQAGWNENIAHLIYRPKIIIVPWCYDDTDYNVFSRYKGSLKNNNYKIINLHCEQLTNADAETLMLPKNSAKDIYHIVWGDYFKNQLLNIGINENLIFKTGSTRLDFFRDEFKYISQSKDSLSAKYNLNKQKKWILLVGNFSYASFCNQNLEIIQKKGYKDIFVMSKLSDDTYFEILKWFEKACGNKLIKDNVEFIYRPHPSETKTNEICELEKKYNNFHILSDLAIRDWILNSDLVFSWCSTSAVEVNAAGIPIFNWRPYEIPSMLKFTLLENIDQIMTCEDFVSKIQSCCNNTIENRNVNNFAKNVDYYYMKSERSATDLTVDVIKKIIKTPDNCVQRKEYFFYGIKKVIAFYFKKILHRIKVLRRIDRYQILDDGYVNEKVIDSFRKKINNEEKV